MEKPSVTPIALEVQVRTTIQKHAMLAAGEHVVIAVSGGADSTALLLCLHSLAPELHLTITVAHLNHRIRGIEGDADEEFVRCMSADLGIPFVSEIIEVKEQAALAKQNLEQLARQIRYDFLQRTARSVGAQRIAIGHTLNDQAETAIFRIIRGSGIEGLTAIHPVIDGQIIRPLLECSRNSIIEYLKQRGSGYREDSTNKDLRYSRNRIRQELIPYLQRAFNPRLVETIARETSLARETWDLIESQAKKAFENLHHSIDGGIALKTKEVLKLHPALQKQVLRHALRQCLGSLRGITSIHIDTLLSLCRECQSGARTSLPHNSMAVRQFDDLLLLRHEPAPRRHFSYDLAVPGTLLIPEIGAKLSAEI
jgi:tRNA(Ile)-lysidine synthase